jgi:hypothetical protein
MASFLGTTITTAEANKIRAAYTTTNPSTGADVVPALTAVEARLLTQVQTRVRAYEDNVAVNALSKSTFDITS